MRVSVDGGKYTYVITETNAHVLRYGELWKDATGDKFTYSMAAEIESLREQVEKLTKERDAAWSVNPSKSEQVLIEQLAALAEQNAKMRDALGAADTFLFSLCQDLHRERCEDWYPEGAHNAAESMSESMRLIGNSCADFTDVVEALTIPDLASPVLNRIRAEAMEEAAKIANEHEGVAWAVSAIRNRKAELEKSNG